LLFEDPPKILSLRRLEASIVEKWHEAANEISAHGYGLLDPRAEFGRVEEERAIEALLLRVETDAQRLHPGDGGVEGTFLFGERSCRRPPDRQRTVAWYWRQVVGIEQQWLV